MTLTLSPEIEKVLTEEAMRQGTTSELLLEKIFSEMYGSPQKTHEEHQGQATLQI